MQKVFDFSIARFVYDIVKLSIEIKVADNVTFVSKYTFLFNVFIGDDWVVICNTGNWSRTELIRLKNVVTGK